MRDELDQLLKRMAAREERALHKLSLIQEGLVDDITLERLGGPALALLVRTRISAEKAPKSKPQYHQPCTRPLRLQTGDGRETIHFRFKAISKTTKRSPRVCGGRKGKAKAAAQAPQASAATHGRYIERNDAVAEISTSERSPTAETRDRAGSSDHGEADDVTNEKANVRRKAWSHADVSAAVTGRPVFQSDVEDAGGGVRSAGDRYTADLSQLPLGGLDGAIERPAGVVYADADAGGADRRHDPQLRWLAPGEGLPFTGRLNWSPSVSAEQDRYIDRVGAVAWQPDGTRALITNIDQDAGRRETFWKLVEEHEREAGKDGMSVRFADHPEFWARIVSQQDCPHVLKAQHDLADHDQSVRFEVESGAAIRTFLRRDPDWITNEKKPKSVKKEEWDNRPQPQAKFHDAREGRVQYRIVGELPREFSAEECTDTLRDLTEEFAHRGLPFVAVVHAPDAHNHDDNWHFHLIFYDRPCRRLVKADIRDLDRQGYDVAGVRVGDWDFATKLPVPGRKNRWKYPLRRRKVREIADDDFIMKMRTRLTDVTNLHLAAAGVSRRVDPRSYADMGIPADPQEHLGTQQSAAEARGLATATGISNEAKQNEAMLAQIDERRRAARAEAARRVAVLRTSGTTVKGRTPILELAQRLRAGIEFDYAADLMGHRLSRAGSRAEHVRRVNQKLLDAARIDKTILSAKEREVRQNLVFGAVDYSDWLAAGLRDERRFVEDHRDLAKKQRDLADEIERKLTVEQGAQLRAQEAIPASDEREAVADDGARQPPENASANAPDDVADHKPVIPSIAQTPTPAQPSSVTPLGPTLAERTPDDWGARPSAQAPSIASRWQPWLRQIERRRPLIVVERGRFSVDGDRQDEHLDEPAVQRKLRALFERQAEDINFLVDYLSRAPGSVLEPRTGESGAHFEITGVSLPLTVAFRRYQGASELQTIIAKITPREPTQSQQYCATRQDEPGPKPIVHAPTPAIEKATDALAAPFNTPSLPVDDGGRAKEKIRNEVESQGVASALLRAYSKLQRHASPHEKVNLFNASNHGESTTEHARHYQDRHEYEVLIKRANAQAEDGAITRAFLATWKISLSAHRHAPSLNKSELLDIEKLAIQSAIEQGATADVIAEIVHFRSPAETSSDFIMGYLKSSASLQNRILDNEEELNRISIREWLSRHEELNATEERLMSLWEELLEERPLDSSIAEGDRNRSIDYHAVSLMLKDNIEHTVLRAAVARLSPAVRDLPLADRTLYAENLIGGVVEGLASDRLLQHPLTPMPLAEEAQSSVSFTWAEGASNGNAEPSVGTSSQARAAAADAVRGDRTR